MRKKIIDKDRVECAAHWFIEDGGGNGHCLYYKTRGGCKLLHSKCPYDGRHEKKYPPTIVRRQLEPKATEFLRRKKKKNLGLGVESPSWENGIKVMEEHGN